MIEHLRQVMNSPRVLDHSQKQTVFDVAFHSTVKATHAADSFRAAAKEILQVIQRAKQIRRPTGLKETPGEALARILFFIGIDGIGFGLSINEPDYFEECSSGQAIPRR